MSSVLIKLLEKCKIFILFHWLLISVTTNFTDSFGKFTKELLLLRLAGRLVNFQSSFVSRISSKHTTILMRYWDDVYMTSRRHVFTMITVITCATAVFTIILFTVWEIAIFSLSLILYSMLYNVRCITGNFVSILRP